MKPLQILAADIGGTHSRFARFLLSRDGTLVLKDKTWLPSRRHTGLTSLLNGLAATSFPLSPQEADMTVLAVKGPVVSGLYCRPPGLDWCLDLSHAARDYGMRRFLLINDFVAQAFATRSPAAEGALTVRKGKGDPQAATLAIGAGTGLGLAALVPDGTGRYVAVPSEGGHAAFPFLSPREDLYRKFLIGKMGNSGLECDVVVSGRGLALLQEFLTGEALSPEEASERVVSGSETLEWMARFYGRVCRDSALLFLARGGIFIAGGVAGRKPALVTTEAFMNEFLNSATMGEILQQIPVRLLTDTDSGLWGAAFAATLTLMKNRETEALSRREE